MYKKVRCTCKVLVLPTKFKAVVFDVLVAVASWDRIEFLLSKKNAVKRDQAIGSLRYGDWGGGCC